MNYAFLSPRDLAFHLRIQEGDIAALDQIKAAMMQKTHGVKTADDVI